MKRKIISAIIIIVLLTLLFFLIRAAVNAFSNDPEPQAPTRTESSISQTERSTEDRPAPTTPAPNSTGSANSSTPNTPAAGQSGQALASTGPKETVALSVGLAVAVASMVVIRRRQVAQL